MELGKSYGIVVLSISTIFVLLLGMVPLPAHAGNGEFALKCYPGLFDPVIDPPVVNLVDQFGLESVDLGPGGVVVCEEALKLSDVPPLDPRHWTLYLFEGTKDFGTKVLTDQFGTETVTGALSTDLLTPATKDNQSPPHNQHWTSYEILNSQIIPGPVLVSDQFGTSTLDLGPAVLFLTNTFKNNEGEPTGPDMKCYFIAGETPPTDPQPHVYADQFGGPSTVDPDPAVFFCVMAQKSSPTPVGGEFLGVDTTSLLLAGAQANALWLIPVIVSAVGIGIVLARKF